MILFSHTTSKKSRPFDKDFQHKRLTEILITGLISHLTIKKFLLNEKSSTDLLACLSQQAAQTGHKANS